MRTEKRTPETPWQVIDLFTDLCLGWYDTDTNARIAHPTGVSCWYRPTRKKAK